MTTQTDTRTRIQALALELFTEHGYEATSLREIAERLGVTKAALYYHFKTKEEIVSSLVEDRARMVEDVIAWARTQPRTAATREELIRRYAATLLPARQREIMRFVERNPTALRDNPASTAMRRRWFEILDLLSGAEDPPAVRLKRSLGLLALHAASPVLRSFSLSDSERRAAVLSVALELVTADSE
jgi:AcrR family transcriptional regulator